MNKLITLALLGILAIACTKQDKTQSKLHSTKDYSGSYVSEDYFHRAEGYDWIAVMTHKEKNNSYSISIRSRADKKKPTCTLDTKAYYRDSNLFAAQIEGKTVLFAFTDSTIHIYPEKAEDDGVLYFCCSGGATAAGTYKKIDGSLDKTQIDSTSFIKVLHLQGVGFNVSSKPQCKRQILSIFPFGLNEDAHVEKQTVSGKIIDAEVADLNADGSPELLVYTQHGSNEIGQVIAFSVNDHKSMSRIHIKPINKHDSILNGYEGFDDFSIVENNLCRRFPIFENGKKSNFIRQINYELTEGEAMRQLVIKSVNDIQL